MPLPSYILQHWLCSLQTELKAVPSLCGLDSHCGKKEKNISKCCLGQFYNVGNQSLSLKTFAVARRCSALSKLVTHIQTESFLRNANFSWVLLPHLFMMSDLSWANMITDTTHTCCYILHILYIYLLQWDIIVIFMDAAFHLHPNRAS